MKEAPAWLAEFQESFGKVLRTPLEQSNGMLLSHLPKLWTELGVLPRSQRAAAAGLSDYQRQYWFRLLTVLQEDFSLTTHLMGLRAFNQWAQKYLLEVPPRAYDLAKVREHFADFLKSADQPALFLQAVQLDEIRAEVFMAPDHQPWQWQVEESDEPALIELRAAPDWRIFHEEWALVDLYLHRPHLGGDAPCPEPQGRAQSWLIQRDVQGLVYRPVTKTQARLYELLAQKNIMDAIATLESECVDEDLRKLQALVQQWMSQSVSWGLWAAKD